MRPCFAWAGRGKLESCAAKKKEQSREGGRPEAVPRPELD